MTHEELADVWQHPLVHRFPSVLALLEEAACLPGGVTQVELGVSYKASGLLALANKRLLHSNEEMLARGNLARDLLCTVSCD
ncbi:hypothetical protein HaLaN_07800 [Haematococcus lacustris]|uniref:Uncharacterized protein n=1 Tax=Haematococcus lacustris TaxID=44745 RepID=A0A699YZI1_HAELA|nr:hypothetical protein HaLaN_07800 [Haematococcus lacustris]